MSGDIGITALTSQDFAPFGDVVELKSEPTMMINKGHCARHHDLASLDILGADARTGISLFDARPYALPLTLDLVERHPLGSQAFIPMTEEPFLVVVAPDDNGKPGTPLAWLTNGHQGVNYRRNTWHGVLTPVLSRARFAVVDRIGKEANLQEHVYSRPWRIVDVNGLLKRHTH